MKLPENLSKWISNHKPPYKSQDLQSGEFFEDTLKKGMWTNGARATAQEILTNPQKYNLVPMSEVEKLALLLAETLKHSFKEKTYESCTEGLKTRKKVVKSISDYEAFKKGGESGI